MLLVLFSGFFPIILNLFGDRVLRLRLLFDLCLFRVKYLADPVTDFFQRLQFLLHCRKLPGIFCVRSLQLFILRLQGFQINIQVNTMLFQKTVRLVVCVQFVPVAFRINGLHRFPADSHILVMDSFMLLTICNGVLDAGNHFHAALGFPHAGADAAGFLLHFLQHTVQLLQCKNLMVFQIIGGVDKGL